MFKTPFSTTLIIIDYTQAHSLCRKLGCFIIYFPNTLRNPIGITGLTQWLSIYLIIYLSSLNDIYICIKLKFYVYINAMWILRFIYISHFCIYILYTCYIFHKYNINQIRSVAQSCLTLCYPTNHSTPGLPVHHQLPEFPETHVHRVSDAIQSSHPLSSPSPPAPNPSQHQSLFQWVNSSHEVAKVLEFQL